MKGIWRDVSIKLHIHGCRKELSIGVFEISVGD